MSPTSPSIQPPDAPAAANAAASLRTNSPTSPGGVARRRAVVVVAPAAAAVRATRWAPCPLSQCRGDTTVRDAISKRGAISIYNVYLNNIYQYIYYHILIDHCDVVFTAPRVSSHLRSLRPLGSFAPSYRRARALPSLLSSPSRPSPSLALALISATGECAQRATRLANVCSDSGRAHAARRRSPPILALARSSSSPVPACTPQSRGRPPPARRT